MKNPIREFIRLVEIIVRANIERAKYENIDGAGEIGWAMMWLCCALPCCVTIILPKTSMWQVGVAFLLIICGGLALLCVPRTIKKYVACCRDTKYVQLGIIVSLAVVVGGSIEMVRLMLPAIARLMLFEMRHPSATSHTVNFLADKGLLFMLVVPTAFLYVKEAGSISKHPWKWPLLVLIVLGPIVIDLIVPHYFMLTMLFLGVVWLISGGATLYMYVRHTPSPAPKAA
jgi:hypothetical protein